MTIKLYSWNVNGIRAVIKKGFADFMSEYSPDILCLQETKINEGQNFLEFSNYQQYWYGAERKGYSSTAVFTKVKPLNVSYGMGISKHDKEGRVLTLEFKTFFLVNVYTVNSQRGLTRFDYRMEWDDAFYNYLKKLEKKKPVIFCGDLNVAHTEIDLANPKTNRKNAGFTDGERKNFSRFVDNGFVDTFREFDKSEGKYSWWTYMANARTRNIGWRIDYFLVSKSLKNKLKNGFILPDVMGSDHCPVGIEIEVK